MPFPYQDRAALASFESVGHECLITFNGQTLELEDGTLTFDEANSPHVRFLGSFRVPDDQTFLDSLDPRKYPRVQISLGYRYAGGDVDRPLVADLSLTRRAVSRPDNAMALLAESDEALVGEYSRLGADWTLGTTLRPTDWITSIITTAIPTATVQLNAYREPTPQTQPFVIKAGDDPMRAVIDIADRAPGLWVYDNGLRQWQIRERPVLGAAVAILQVGVNGTILDSTTEMSREDWGNAVAVIHEWRDGTTTRSVTAYAETIDGPYAVSAIGRKVYTVRRESPADATSAYNSAVSILRRVLSRGRSITLDAISDYRLRPGDTISVQLPNGPQERHLVAAVRFDLARGRMTVVTRQPQNAQIF